MEKEVYTVKDLEIMFNCAYNKACQKMREIKSVSDTLEIRGVIHKNDYEAWLQRRQELARGTK